MRKLPAELSAEIDRRIREVSDFVSASLGGKEQVTVSLTLYVAKAIDRRECSVEERAAYELCGALAPSTYRVRLDEKHLYELTCGTELERRYQMRDAMLSAAEALGLSPLSAGVVLLEMAASILEPQMDGPTFEHNAEFWYRSVALSRSGAIVNAPGVREPESGVAADRKEALS